MTPPTPIPNEDERRATFMRECESFAMSIQRRIAELQEPGKRVDGEEVADLMFLLSLVRLAKQHASGRDVRGWRKLLLQADAVAAERRTPVSRAAGSCGDRQAGVRADAVRRYSRPARC